MPFRVRNGERMSETGGTAGSVRGISGVYRLEIRLAK